MSSSRSKRPGSVRGQDDEDCKPPPLPARRSQNSPKEETREDPKEDRKMPAASVPGAVAMGGSGLDPAAVKQAAAIDPSRLSYASGSASVTASGGSASSTFAAAARTIQEEEKEEITASATPTAKNDSSLAKPAASRTGSRAVGAVAVAGMGGGASNTETIDEDYGEDWDIEPKDSAPLPAAEAVSAELVDDRPQPQDLEAQVQDQVTRFLQSTQVAQVEPMDEKPPPAGGLGGNKKKTYIIIGVLALAIIGGVIGAVVALTGGDDPSPAPPTAPPLPTTPPTPAPVEQQCTLCFDGSTPANLDTNRMLDGTPCATFKESVETLTTSNPSCAQAQAAAWNNCECPTLPPAPENPSCKLCGDGPPPTDEVCANLDTYVAYVENFAGAGSCEDLVAEALDEGSCLCPADPDELEALRAVLLPISGDSLDVPGSPQNQAMTWMLTEDPGKLELGSVPNDVIRLRYAAAVIYFSFEGESWLSQLNFLTAGSICTWFQGDKGIICERNTDEATQLVLSENRLGGAIPPEISVLSDLEIINVDTNNILGTIPESIGNMANLEEIDLDMNEIFGSIPSEIFLISRLKNFYASSNDLTGTIPDNVGDARNLELFFAEKNDLRGPLPASVGQGVGALRAVALSDNSITGTIPDFASNRDDFFGILASRNRLRGPLPASFGALPNLALVALTDNILTGTLPDFSANQNTFQGLQINLNRLTGNISNFFETVPPGKVTSVWFDDNLLGGTIPTQIGLFTSLTDLRLNGNSNIEGTIPSEIGLLTKLSSALWLDENRITGTLPSEIGGLTSLILLATRKNQLTGDIPEELANCQGLRILDLSDNMMTGNVSTLFDTITRDLVLVDFDQNMFTGTIPASIGELNNLAFFDLGVNNINGTLPTELGLLTAMSSLSFLQNDMVGTIPSQLGLMTKLTFLSLGGNMFTGTVPTQLAQLTKMDRLTLQDNDLTGNVDAICDAGIPLSIFAVETCGDPDNQALLECGCCTHCCEDDSFTCRAL